MSKAMTGSTDDSIHALEQHSHRVKGPAVWLDMDQKELDDAYNPIVWAPNQEHVGKRRRLASERTLARIGPPQRFPYGETDVEKLDLYLMRRINAPNPYLY